MEYSWPWVHFCIPFQGPGCRSMVSICCCCLTVIFGAQVDVESQQFELYSSQPRLSSMFVSSCLGSQVFKQKTLRRCSENPKEVMALELPILRGQIGCCWISDEMVGRWVLFLFGKNLLWYLNSNLLNFGRCLSILWKNIVRNKLERDLPQSFFFQTQCYWVGIIHHYIGMYHTACSDLQVPPEELCHKLRFLYADVEYGAMNQQE